MQIYTGTMAGEKLDKAKELGLGIMISPSTTFPPRKEYREFPCALDNGAFQASRRGFPFPETQFLKCIDKCYDLGLNQEITGDRPVN